MNLLTVALILALRWLMRWADTKSMQSLDRDCRVIVPDWDK